MPTTCWRERHDAGNADNAKRQTPNADNADNADNAERQIKGQARHPPTSSRFSRRSLFNALNPLLTGGEVLNHRR
jgi:hypothetical protein